MLGTTAAQAAYAAAILQPAPRSFNEVGLYYSFDNTKVSGGTPASPLLRETLRKGTARLRRASVTDPRYAEGFGEASESGNGKTWAIMNV